jgi:hypothetical protein
MPKLMTAGIHITLQMLEALRTLSSELVSSFNQLSELKLISESRSILRVGDTPKSGHGRTVDMAVSVRDVLRRHHARLSEAWLERKPSDNTQGNERPKGKTPPCAFPSGAWTPQDHAD